MATPHPAPLPDVRLADIAVQARALRQIEMWRWKPLGDARATRALRPIGAGGEAADLASDPALCRYLDAVPPRTVAELVAEVHTLREGLRDAVRALDGLGFTREAYARLAPEARSEEPWPRVVQAWAAAGAPVEPPEVVLQLSTGSRRERRSYPTVEHALEAAIDAIEANAGYPERIERNGSVLVDQASILRAWEDRHDPA